VQGRTARESITQVMDSSETSPGVYRTRRAENVHDGLFQHPAEEPLMDFDFALLLVVLTALTGVIWLFDRLFLVAGRKRKAEAIRSLELVSAEEREARAQQALREPIIVEYAHSFFPVIFAILLFRSFLAEPFKIPSGSMMPTLLVGDFILVNKFAYGIRLPVANEKVLDIGDPHRGDVMVFRYPDDPSLDYIKRVVGLPGDRVEYVNKRLTINGQPVPVRQIEDYLSRERMQFSRRYVETLGGTPHEILLEDDAPAAVVPTRATAGNCNYNSGGLACTVPPGHYFVMGDNRDNSSDSRVWGFVPDENIVGKAFFIWLNLNDLGRFGPFH
jgi:signal peptidase I